MYSLSNLLSYFNSRYASTFFICQIPRGLNPVIVSLVTENTLNSHPLNRLRVQAVGSQIQNNIQITECLSPLHSRFDDMNVLIEWIELNRILGINYFTVYVTSVTQRVLDTLEFYRNKGVLEIVNWPISEVINLSDVDYFGQQVALNDCLYRNKRNTKFIMSVDLDEFIVPQSSEHNSIQDILSTLPMASCYMFRHLTFYRPSLNEENKIFSLSNVYRSPEILQPRIRSKVIVVADDVTTLAVHDTWALKNGLTHFVGTNLGLLHHYKQDVVAEDGWWKSRQSQNVNKVMFKYKDKLVQNVKHVMGSLKENIN